MDKRDDVLPPSTYQSSLTTASHRAGDGSSNIVEAEDTEQTPPPPPSTATRPSQPTTYHPSSSVSQRPPARVRLGPRVQGQRGLSRADDGTEGMTPPNAKYAKPQGYDDAPRQQGEGPKPPPIVIAHGRQESSATFRPSEEYRYSSETQHGANQQVSPALSPPSRPALMGTAPVQDEPYLLHIPLTIAPNTEKALKLELFELFLGSSKFKGQFLTDSDSHVVRIEGPNKLEALRKMVSWLEQNLVRDYLPQDPYTRAALRRKDTDTQHDVVKDQSMALLGLLNHGDRQKSTALPVLGSHQRAAPSSSDEGDKAHRTPSSGSEQHQEDIQTEDVPSPSQDQPAAPYEAHEKQGSISAAAPLSAQSNLAVDDVRSMPAPLPASTPRSQGVHARESTESPAGASAHPPASLFMGLPRAIMAKLQSDDDLPLRLLRQSLRIESIESKEHGVLVKDPARNRLELARLAIALLIRLLGFSLGRQSSSHPCYIDNHMFHVFNEVQRHLRTTRLDDVESVVTAVADAVKRSLPRLAEPGGDNRPEQTAHFEPPLAEADNERMCDRPRLPKTNPAMPDAAEAHGRVTSPKAAQNLLQEEPYPESHRPLNHNRTPINSIRWDLQPHPHRGRFIGHRGHHLHAVQDLSGVSGIEVRSPPMHGGRFNAGGRRDLPKYLFIIGPHYARLDAATKDRMALATKLLIALSDVTAHGFFRPDPRDVQRVLGISSTGLLNEQERSTIERYRAPFGTLGSFDKASEQAIQERERLLSRFLRELASLHEDALVCQRDASDDGECRVIHNIHIERFRPPLLAELNNGTTSPNLCLSRVRISRTGSRCQSRPGTRNTGAT